MNTREIAQTTGKNISTVQRWIQKMGGKMQSIDGKMQSSTSTHPANFDLEETIAIIEAGMGKNAAAIYRSNARENISTPADSLLSQREMQMIKSIVSAAVVETINAILPAQGIVKKGYHVPVLDFAETHMTVLGFCHEQGFTVSMPEAIRLGKEAARLSREENVSIKKVPDDRFGSVNSYHKAILQKVMSL